MAPRRYYFLFDASDPLRWVDRYLANASLPQRVSGLAAAAWRGPAMMAAQTDINRELRERIREEAALTARLATLDLFAPTRWAVESAAALDAQPDRVPDALRAFFAVPHANTDQLILCADREGALDALAAARSLSLAQIGAMEPAAQTEAVVARWRDFARYFERLGVSVLGWARYRNAWHRALGGSDTGPGTFTSSLQSPWSGAFPEGYEQMFRARPEGGPVPAANVAQAAAALTALAERPLDPPWSPEILARLQAQGITAAPTADSAIVRGAVRTNLANMAVEAATPARSPTWVERAREAIGAAYNGRRPDHVYFGSKWEVFEEQQLTGLPTGQTTGTGRSVFRLSIGADGRLAVRLGDPAQFERQHCFPVAPGSGLPAPRPGFAWTCSAFTEDAQGRGFFLAPLLWYAELLQPLLDYLATRDPLEVIYEIALDVLGKNLWTTIGTGRGEAALAQLAATAGLRGWQGGAAAAQRVQSGLATGIGTAAALAGAINPIFGAAVGAGGALLDLAASSSPAAPPRPFADVLGRVEPVVERLLLGGARARPWQCSESDPTTPLALTTHGADIERTPFTLALATPAILAAATRELHVVGMVPNAAVAINGTPLDVRAGRWTDASYGWSIPVPVTVPSGLSIVTVTPPGEAPRSYQLPIRPEGVTNLAYATMTTGPVLRLLRMVPGGLTYVDGVLLDNATGHAEDNFTTWVLPLPAALAGRSVEVRVQTPQGPVRGAAGTLAAAGPTNVDFAALPVLLPPAPLSPAPVRDMAVVTTGERRVWPWAVGAVLLVALAAGAYLLLRGKRKKNGRRKRRRGRG